MSDRATDQKSLRWYHGLTRYHYLVLVVASCGWMFDTMDQWLYVLAKGPALNELLQAQKVALGLTDAQYADLVKHYTGTVQMLWLFGWATGGFLFGMVGDRLGRTRTMAITVALYAGFTGLSALTRTWEQFAVCRFLVALGVGGEFAAGAALVAEVFPDHARATALGIMQAASAIGNMTAGLINLTVGANPDLGWRWVFGIGLAPALLVFIIRLFVREPERWEHARKTAALAAASAKGTGSGQRLGSIVELFRTPELRRNTLVGVGLAAVGVIGFWGIGTWSPELLRAALNPSGAKLLPEAARALEQKASLAVMAQNFGAFFGILTWAWLAQRLGRRGAFALTFLGCLVIVPVTFHCTTSFASALLLYPLMGFALTSLFGGYAIYFPELYPTRLRATGTGFCYNTARYVSAASPSLFANLSQAMGIRAAATSLSAIFVFGLAVLLFARETRGQPLPE